MLNAAVVKMEPQIMFVLDHYADHYIYIFLSLVSQTD